MSTSRSSDAGEPPGGATGGSLSVYSVPGMDCPTESGLVEMTLRATPGVARVDVDLRLRQVKVTHVGDSAHIEQRLAALGLGLMRLSVEPTQIEPTRIEPASGVQGALAHGHDAERTVLRTVLVINAVMFVVELVAGWLADSTGLLADSLDMFADALVYAAGLKVVGGSKRAQGRSALLAAGLQTVMGVGVLIEVVRRAVMGSEPTSLVMMATAGLALLANLECTRLLHRHRHGGAHMQASWIFTATDVIANLGVVLAGALVWFTHLRLFDLVIGAAIAAFVLYGALRILRVAMKS